MREFMTLDLKGPATMEAVLEAVMRLSTYDEAEILKLVSEGNLREKFPFRPADTEIGPDFVSEDEIVEASAFPIEDRKTLIQSSMPHSAEASAPKIRVQSRLQALINKIKHPLSSSDS